MAKSLSVHKGFCGIYEKNGHGSFTVLVYKYGEPYKLLDEFYVDTEENIIRDFHANVDFYLYGYDELSGLPFVMSKNVLSKPDSVRLKDLMS